MGFWIYILVMSLLIPIILVAVGELFYSHTPKMNSFFGYRTKWSKKSEETWKFAHWNCGRLWRIWGLLLLPICLPPLIIVRAEGADTVYAMGLVIVFLQMIPLIGSIISTECALRKKFNAKGEPIDDKRKKLN